MDSIDIIDCRTTNLVRLQIPATVGVSRSLAKPKKQPNDIKPKTKSNWCNKQQPATSNDNKQLNNSRSTSTGTLHHFIHPEIPFQWFNLSLFLYIYKYIDIYRTEV